MLAGIGILIQQSLKLRIGDRLAGTLSERQCHFSPASRPAKS
jgi:hypothetical protein